MCYCYFYGCFERQYCKVWSQFELEFETTSFLTSWHVLEAFYGYGVDLKRSLTATDSYWCNVAVIVERTVVRFLHPTKNTHVAIILVTAHNLRIQSWFCLLYVDVSTHIGAVTALAVGLGGGAKCGKADLAGACCKSVTYDIWWDYWWLGAQCDGF